MRPSFKRRARRARAIAVQILESVNVPAAAPVATSDARPRAPPTTAAGEPPAAVALDARARAALARGRERQAPRPLRALPRGAPARRALDEPDGGGGRRRRRRRRRRLRRRRRRRRRDRRPRAAAADQAGDQSGRGVPAARARAQAVIGATMLWDCARGAGARRAARDRRGRRRLHGQSLCVVEALLGCGAFGEAHRAGFAAMEALVEARAASAPAGDAGPRARASRWPRRPGRRRRPGRASR